MFKKRFLPALIGAIVVVVAVLAALTAIDYSVKHPKPASTPKPKATQQVVTQQPVPTQVIVTPTPQPTPTPTPVPTPEVPKQTSAISVIDPANLGDNISEQDEIMLVSKKRLILLDEGYGTDTGKMLNYVVDMYSTDQLHLVLPVNAGVWENIAVGDQVQVNYKVYTNKSGVRFPVIVSATLVQK